MEDGSNTALNLKQFYKELAHVWYAIAFADGAIQKEETEALRSIILKKLLPLELEEDSSGMNMVFYSQFEFDELISKRAPAHLTFLQFLNYLKSNAANLTDRHKRIIIDSVRTIAESYNRPEKKEKELIGLLITEITNL